MRQVQYKNLQESKKGHQENLNRFQLLRTGNHLGPTRCWKHNWKTVISYQMLWVKVLNRVIENFEKSSPAENTMNFESILLFWVWSSNIVRYSSRIQSSLWGDYWWGTKWQWPLTAEVKWLSKVLQQAVGEGSWTLTSALTMLLASGTVAVGWRCNLFINYCLFVQLDKFLRILGWLINLTT